MTHPNCRLEMTANSYLLLDLRKVHQLCVLYCQECLLLLGSARLSRRQEEPGKFTFDVELPFYKVVSILLLLIGTSRYIFDLVSWQIQSANVS